MSELLEVLPEIIGVIAALIGAVTALVQALKAKKFRRVAEKSEEALEVLQAGVALLPDSDEKTKLEATVDKMSRGMADHGAKLAETAARVWALLAQHGIVDEGDNTARALQAGDVVRAYRKERLS